MDIRYPARIEAEDEGGFFVQFVDLDDAFTEGDTLDDALRYAAEVLSLVLEWRMDEGRPIPAPTQGLTGVHYIAPEAQVQAALAQRFG